MALYTPPHSISYRNITLPSVFLAGTIDMGQSEDWQEDMYHYFDKLDFNVFNPRRKDWDNSWPQEYISPQLYQQVHWELNAMERADFIIMFFEKDSKSPITIGELGLHAKSGKLYVVCEDGFYRKGNIDAICDFYGAYQFHTLDNLKEYFNKIYHV